MQLDLSIIEFEKNLGLNTRVEIISMVDNILQYNYRIQLETPRSKIYFSTDGTKPNPFQMKVGGRESTFKYRAAFSLKSGKRTLKAVAVSR